MLKRVYHIALRECGVMWKHPIYGFCMVVFPIVAIVFFTSLMEKGVPDNLPIGIVDQDNTATTRGLIRDIDAFETTKVAAYYDNMDQARTAMQRNEIYGFLLIPEGTTRELQSSRQPDISFYYSNISLIAGSLIFRDLKTATTLEAASVGIAKLASIGKTNEEINTFLQPIALDMHMTGNPYSNYNYYLSTTMIPGVILLFVFLITPYSIGTELKFGRAKEWMRMANNNVHVAIMGKMLPQTLIFVSIFYAFELYIYAFLDFPHPGGIVPILLLGLLSILASQCFGIFAFGLMPSLRMSMSVCSLWGVMSFSICGATYPTFAMSPFLQGVAVLFPLRHYYMVYQISILHGFPLQDAVPYLLALCVFVALPILTIWNIKKAMLVYKYLP